jgi:hypothetical protein
MSAARVVLLKMALRAAERGDAEGAAEALRGVLAMGSDAEATSATTTADAVTVPAFARVAGYSGKHVRTLLRRGDIPAEAVIGRGRATRIRVDLALAALRPGGVDAIARDAEDYAAGRARLRVVRRQA